MSHNLALIVVFMLILQVLGAGSAPPAVSLDFDDLPDSVYSLLAPLLRGEDPTAGNALAMTTMKQYLAGSAIAAKTLGIDPDPALKNQLVTLCNYMIVTDANSLRVVLGNVVPANADLTAMKIFLKQLLPPSGSAPKGTLTTTEISTLLDSIIPRLITDAVTVSLPAFVNLNQLLGVACQTIAQSLTSGSKTTTKACSVKTDTCTQGPLLAQANGTSYSLTFCSSPFLTVLSLTSALPAGTCKVVTDGGDTYFVWNCDKPGTCSVPGGTVSFSGGTDTVTKCSNAKTDSQVIPVLLASTNIATWVAQQDYISRLKLKDVGSLASDTTLLTKLSANGLTNLCINFQWYKNLKAQTVSAALTAIIKKLPTVDLPTLYNTAAFVTTFKSKLAALITVPG